MNSESISPAQALQRFGEIKLTIRRKVPSLNILFKMNPWERSAEKKEMQAALLEAIARARDESLSQSHATSQGHSTQTTWPASTLSTAYDMLACWLTTDHKTSTSGFDKRKLIREAKKKLKLQFDLANKNKRNHV